MRFRSHALPLAVLAIVALGSEACAAALPMGAKYVSMGSSFAAGPGVTTSADAPPTRCGRSTDNYAHQLARKRDLALTDVSCGGAVTANLLAPWGDTPAQLDAVDAATQLVTVTIGGNDLGYMAGLMTASCQYVAQAAAAGAAAPTRCPPARTPTEQDFRDVEGRMQQIAAEVHRRAPTARLVFIQYFTVLPPHGTCAATPLTDAQADAARQLARRLAELTARAATAGGADLLPLDKLSQNHDACAEAPWVNGFPRPDAPVKGAFYHPNLAGMTAVADALDRMLR